MQQLWQLHLSQECILEAFTATLRLFRKHVYRLWSISAARVHASQV